MDNEIFVIDNDQKAEWALQKIAEIDNEYKRLADVCDKQIEMYASSKTAYKDKRDGDRGGLVAMLSDYFETVKAKATKTQATYKLPTGKLVKKLEKADFVHDDKKLIEILENTEFVEQLPKLKWAEFKKTLNIITSENEYGEVVNVVVNDDGEIVEGVTVEIKPATFDVEV